MCAGSADPEDVIPQPIGSPGTVLVIDDEESTGRMVRRHLRGWPVTQVFSIGAVTEELVARVAPLLVLLDLNLGDTSYPDPLRANPFQGSFALARRLRQQLPSLPIVIFSACSNPDNPFAAQLAGAGFLSKLDAAEGLGLLRRRLEEQR